MPLVVPANARSATLAARATTRVLDSAGGDRGRNRLFKSRRRAPRYVYAARTPERPRGLHRARRHGRRATALPTTT